MGGEPGTQLCSRQTKLEPGIEPASSPLFLLPVYMVLRAATPPGGAPHGKNLGSVHNLCRRAVVVAIMVAKSLPSKLSKPHYDPDPGWPDSGTGSANGYGHGYGSGRARGSGSP